MKKCNLNNPKANNVNYICNEKTGVWVKKDGKIGKEILNATKTTKSPKVKSICNPNIASYKKNPGLYICNESTKKWVLKTGKIGQALLKKTPSVKSPKVKPSVKSSVKSPPKEPKEKVTLTNVKKHTTSPKSYQANLYQKQMVRTKMKRKLKIPILEELGITYETWDNKDNTKGTCFWHAVSKGLGLTIPEMADRIDKMADELPGNLKYKYKTKSNVVNKLKNYKKQGFGMGPKGYCIIPKISPNTALIIFAVREVKHKIYETIGVFCIIPQKEIPKKVIFICDYVFLKGGHIEIMTLKGKKININWSQDICNVAEELQSILKHTNCKEMIKRIAPYCKDKK